MNFQLIVHGMDGQLELYFATYDRAFNAATALLLACVPVTVQVMQFEEGRGYKKEVYNSTNEDYV